MKVFRKNFGATGRNMMFILLIVIITGATALAAARPLDGEKPRVGDNPVSKALFPLKRGPVPPSAPSACTDYMVNRKHCSKDFNHG
ncbi:hypothetical protein FH972_002375 [Carpinus fangiana]|uniref:Uncharacterized protein n=1 Tax=Carpinus fangiana TaxID=176857 RepID=A0A5N6QH03_9ROSI|nr:hypothetical protein FH972_002375 [Carpinus fangiana]